MQVKVAHSLRGRLRVRYPSDWLMRQWAAIEPRLRELPGVRSVEARPLTGSVRIDYDPFLLAEDAIVATLRATTAQLDTSSPGPRTPTEHRPRQPKPPAPLLNVLGTTSVLAVTCCLPIPAAVAAGLVLASGLPSLLRAGSTLAASRRMNGDVLEASTLLLTILRGHYAAGALLAWLRSVGEYVVARSVVAARRSLRDLIAPPDQTVLLRTGGDRRPVRIASLRIGDVIAVGSGHRLPVDGTVVGGEALVDQQTMTGEALPVERRAGDRVFAATTLVHGDIDVRVDQLGLDTAVGRIVTVIEAAADEKPDIQVFAERLADREVQRTLVLAGLGSALSWSLDAGTAILAADYGTAARVGTPAALVASMKRASARGILIKGPRVLEALARVDTVVFDKTGTLTSGTPRVSRVVTYMAAVTEDDVVRLAAAAERELRHPVARAIARLAAERRVAVPRATGITEGVGLGVDVRVDGRHVLVGSRRFMEGQGVDLNAARADERSAHAVGASPAFVALDGRLAGTLILQDELREDAPDAVRALRARKMRNVIMLSGDHPEPTRVIAQSLGLRHHYADLLPEDKARLIRELKAEGRVVAMVGDGVNDALALNEADVGIAVPGGAEVATEAADVVLLRGGLEEVVRALDLGQESIAAVRRTLGIAARANLVVVGLASLGFAHPLASILLSHGTTVGAALVSATRPIGRSTMQPAASSLPS